MRFMGDDKSPQNTKAPASTTLRIGQSPFVEARATGHLIGRSGIGTITLTAWEGKGPGPNRRCQLDGAGAAWFPW